MWNNWGFASNATSGNAVQRKICTNPSPSIPDCSDDEASSCASRDEGLECPICWESFNIVENVPYVLWCGHSLCKNCVLGLQWAVVKFPTVPIQLPLFITCPWCNLLSFRFVYKGNLKFPRKNYFLLWMVESMNSGRTTSRSCHGDHQPSWPCNTTLPSGSINGSHHHHGRRVAPHVRQEQPRPNPNQENRRSNYLNVERINASLRKSLAFFLHLTAKFPLVIIFLLIVLYAIPASAVILALYMLISVVFALPSFLILYFAYPSLDWLIREIIT